MLGHARKLLQGLGLDVRRLSPARKMATDPAWAQAQLLRNSSVRTVFDVGANTGQSAQAYRRMFPAAAIYSFEPAAGTFAELTRNCRGMEQVHPWQLALSDVNGKVRFHMNADQTTNSLLESSEQFDNAHLRGKMATVSTVEVDCRTLDSFCGEHSIDTIDLLKLDIQGAELKAIRGGAGMFRAGRIRLVYCEVQFWPMYRDACSFSMVADVMREFGYRLYGLYDLHHFPADGLLWGDAVFVHPDLMASLKPGAPV